MITQDNVSVQIDTVLYFTITDPRAASYEINNPLQGIEQLTVTTLRNIVGAVTLEEALTGRERVNTELRVVLDERTGKWGIRVNGVELKSIDPPASIQEAMEKQMRAERDRRATILTAEGVKQAQILEAEGEKTSSVLRAEGQRSAAILRSEGEAKAIATVFEAIHEGKPDQALLSYQYLQMLPQIAQGDANKVWVIPSEVTQALGNIGGVVQRFGGPPAPPAPPRRSPPEELSAVTRPAASVAIRADRPVQHAGGEHRARRRSRSARPSSPLVGPHRRRTPRCGCLRPWRARRSARRTRQGRRRSARGARPRPRGRRRRSPPAGRRIPRRVALAPPAGAGVCPLRDGSRQVPSVSPRPGP